MNKHLVFDGDAALIEHDGIAVTRVKWIESGIAVEWIDGDMTIVPEYAQFFCGAAVVSGRDLHLIYGEWVPARRARFGNP